MLFNSGIGTIDLINLVIALAAAITIHEAAHAWMAFKLGDRTALEYGRLTLNPLAHLDVWGALFLLLVGFGWGKPVPINPANFKHPRRDEFLSSIAGPAANLLLAVVAGLALRFSWGAASAPLISLLATLTLINLVLMLFNLLPIPPLDGSKILGLILPQRYYFLFQKNGLWILLILIAVSLLGLPIFSWIIFGPSIAIFQLVAGRLF